MPVRCGAPGYSARPGVRRAGRVILVRAAFPGNRLRSNRWAGWVRRFAVGDQSSPAQKGHTSELGMTILERCFPGTRRAVVAG
jgi:hypothetical protein